MKAIYCSRIKQSKKLIKFETHDARGTTEIKFNNEVGIHVATDKIISPSFFFFNKIIVLGMVVAAAALKYETDLIDITRTGRYV